MKQLIYIILMISLLFLYSITGFANENYDIFTDQGDYIDSNGVLHTDTFQINDIKRILLAQGSYYAIDNWGSVYVWGGNKNELGIVNNDDLYIYTPTLLNGVRSIKSVCAVSGCRILLTEDGQIYATGIYAFNNQYFLDDVNDSKYTDYDVLINEDYVFFSNTI